MILRTLFRHLLVLYVFITVYCVHRNKLFGYCNPMKFVESRDCALMKERSLLLLADKDANLAGYERIRKRVYYRKKESALSAVSWVVDCGWREYVTYIYCENAGETFHDRYSDAYLIGDGWYLESAK